jgi:hypothetical protein
MEPTAVTAQPPGVKNFKAPLRSRVSSMKDSSEKTLPALGVRILTASFVVFTWSLYANPAGENKKTDKEPPRHCGYSSSVSNTTLCRPGPQLNSRDIVAIAGPPVK